MTISEGRTQENYDYIDFAPSETIKLSREFLGILDKAIKHRAGDRAHFNKLQQVGQDLYDNFIPRSFKGLLQDRTDEDLVLRIEDRLIHVPWELLFDGEQFLCRRFNVGRIVKTRQTKHSFPQRRSVPPLKLLLLLNPKGDLPAAFEEGKLIKSAVDLYGDKVLITSKGKDIRTDYVRRTIRDFDIVHYAGHAKFDPDKPSLSGWLVKDGTITAAMLARMAGMRPLPSLVFSNACQSSEVSEWSIDEHSEAQVFGLANAFLSAGVRHYIGTFWNLVDEPSAHFAHAFYEALIEGTSIGRSVRLARDQVARRYGEEKIEWASYLLYGDPGYSYLPSLGEALGEKGETPEKEKEEKLTTVDPEPGEAGKEPEDGPRPAVSDKKKIPRNTLVVIFCLLFGIAINFTVKKLNLFDTEEQAPSFTPPSSPLISVLFLKNLSGQKHDELFADGLTQNLIDGLSHVSALRVTPTVAVRELKEKTVGIEEILKRLGCAYFLDGTVQQGADKIRIFVQLVSTENGEQVWNKQYKCDLNMEDIFTIQEDLTERIISAMAVEISTEEKRRLTKRPTESLSAYEYYLLGHEKLRIKEKESIQEAIELFNKAMDSDDSFALASVGLAASHLVRYNQGFDSDIGSLDRAIELCNHALSIDSELAEAHHVLAMIYWQKDDYANAVEFDRRSIELRPGYSEAYYTLGQGYRTMGRYKEARRMLEKCFEFNPRYEKALRGIGSIYEKQEQYRKALSYFERAHKYNPQNLLNRLYLGCVYFHVGNEAKGEALLEGAIEQSPNYIWAYDFLARSYLMRRNLTEAKPLYAKIQELAPNNHNTLNNVGLFYSFSGDHEYARELFNRAIEITPDSVEPRLQLCSSYFQSGYLAKAIDISRTLSALSSAGLEVHLARVQILLAASRDDEALRLAKEISTRFPEDPVALDVYGRMILRKGNLDEVEGLSRQMIVDFEESPRGYNLLAATLIWMGRTKEAFDVQKRGLNQSPEDPETLRCAAEVARRNGDLDKETEWENALRAMALDRFIETAPVGIRWDKLFWLKEGMGLYSVGDTEAETSQNSS